MANSTNNDLQNITQETKYWETRTALKSGDHIRFSERVSSSCPTWHPSSYSCYDKRSISVDICDTDIP